MVTRSAPKPPVSSVLQSILISPFDTERRRGAGAPAPPATWTVLDSDGNPFVVPLTVLNSSGTSFNVPAAVLNSSGTSFNPI